MKLCFLADARAEHTRRWTKYFALRGHQVDLITLNPDVLGGYDPVRLHLIKKPLTASGLLYRFLNAPRVVGGIREVLAEVQPDVVHAHSVIPYVWLAMLSGFRPYLATPWGTDVLVHARASLVNFLMTVLALRKARMVVCDAEFMRTELQRFGVRPGAVRLIMFGVDLTRFRPATSGEADTFRRREGLGTLPIVVSTRTLFPVHDVATFLRAMPLILAAFPETIFVVVGDGSERLKMQALASTLGVAQSVRFVGRVEEDEMLQWLHIADVYVSTSLQDAGLAASTAEAMACSLPVVISNNGDNGRWITDGVNGYLMPAGDQAALAARVVSLLRDPEKRVAFGRVNRALIEDRNNYPREMDKMEQIYRDAAASKGNHGRAPRRDTAG